MPSPTLPVEPPEGFRHGRQPDNPRAIVQDFELRYHRHLTDDILAFWIKHAPDRVDGGFYGELDRQGRPVASRPKSLVQHARFLWSFSSAYRLDPRPAYREMADRALSFLVEHFHDPRRLGWFWLVAPDGRPLDRQKHLYGQAFAIYGLSEYALAFGDREALRLARDTFGAVDHHGYDSEHGGYRESFSLDWNPTAQRRHLGAMGHQKTTNTHIHLLESFATLYRASQDDRVGTRVRELINLFTTTIIDRARGCTHEMFERDWTPCRSVMSFGHDIETSWLLTDACQAVRIHDAELVREVALILARTVAQLGVDHRNGGVFYEASQAGRVTHRRKEWWVQAEALVGFLNAYALSGDNTFLEALLSVERWVFARQVDTQYGEWHHAVGPWGRIRGEKAGIWKTPYHTARASMELSRGRRHLADQAAP